MRALDRYPRSRESVAVASPTRWSRSKKASFASTRRLCGHGAGAGNTPIEAFVAVGIPATWSIVRCRTPETLVRPIQDRRSLTKPPATRVYSIFYERAAQRHALDVRDILLEVGRGGLVGGQEDMIGDVALDLAISR